MQIESMASPRPWGQSYEDGPTKRTGKEQPEREESSVLETTQSIFRRSNLGYQILLMSLQSNRTSYYATGADGSDRNYFKGVVGAKPVGSGIKRQEKRGRTQLDTSWKDFLGNGGEKWAVDRRHKASVSIFLFKLAGESVSELGINPFCSLPSRAVLGDHGQCGQIVCNIWNPVFPS